MVKLVIKGFLNIFTSQTKRVDSSVLSGRNVVVRGERVCVCQFRSFLIVTDPPSNSIRNLKPGQHYFQIRICGIEVSAVFRVQSIIAFRNDLCSRSGNCPLGTRTCGIPHTEFRRAGLSPPPGRNMGFLLSPQLRTQKQYGALS